MSKITTFFTAVSRELNAGVQIVANIKDDERMAAMAVAKAAAEKEKSIKSRQRFQERLWQGPRLATIRSLTTQG